MNNMHLLNDKFATVNLPKICVPRHKLLNTFTQAADKRVIFVSAPAGYGKTISTLLWLNSSGCKFIWIGLDRYDNTLSIFYKLFCTAILAIQPQNKAMADILKSPAFASSPVEHTISLLSEFVPDEKRYTLVLDDMHLVNNKEIRESGLLVRKRLPASFLILILTRNEVTAEITSAVGTGKYALITARELAFSENEIHKYFGRHGHFITKEEAAAVRTITEGWAIGVNALAMSGKIEPGQNGTHILENYIQTQIWDNWDKSLRNFMLKTAIVDEMTARLCERLTGREDSREVLEMLVLTNSFVSGTAGGTCRYHHLFLDFLRNRPEAAELDLKGLYKLAAGYYMETGEYLKARRYAVKSDDTETIMRTMFSFNQDASFNLYASQSVSEYANYLKILNLDALPESVCARYPFLYVSHIGYCFMMGDARGTEQYLDKLYLSLPVVARDFPKYLSTCILESILDHRISFSKQNEYFEQFPPVIAESTPFMFSLTMQIPFLHRSSKDFSELCDEKLIKGLRMTYGALMRENIEIMVSGIRSGIYLEQNRLADAMDEALRTYELTDENTSRELRYSAMLHLAAAHHAAGDDKRFSEMLNQTESYIDNHGAHYLRPNLIAYKTKILLMGGNCFAAKTWLENYYVFESEQLELYKIFQHFTTARAYMVLAQTDKAMRYILKLKQLGVDFKRPLDLAEASVLQAALEWALGRRHEAQDTLEAALTAMQTYGFVRVFADEGAAILPILRKISLKLKKEHYHGLLQSQYLSEVTIATYKQSKRYKGIAIYINEKAVRLSKQQRLILTFLSKGYKYKEIMEATGLTIHTVKSHASAAYAKLDVNNSLDAVLKARELGIIK